MAPVGADHTRAYPELPPPPDGVQGAPPVNSRVRPGIGGATLT